MNYNSNTFVISIGEHLTTIAYQAPWMNGQPINHGQAYMILCALHEELFNEIFPWAKIDNSLQDAIAQVYQGFQALVPRPPRLWRHNGREWQMVTNAIGPIVDVPLHGGLPKQPQVNATYRVHGGVTYDQCFNQFIDGALAHIRWALRTEINKYMGIYRDYEWYFEYAGNGITYTRQNKAVINYVNVEPETEVELLQQEINALPKPEQLTPAYVMINLAENETRGGFDKTTGEVTPNKFEALMQNMPAVINQLTMHAMQSGVMKAEIMIRYANPAFLREVCDCVDQCTRNSPVKFLIRSEQVQIGLAPVVNQVDRALQQRSLEQVQGEATKLATKLTAIRDRIARRNNVTDLDIREINHLDKNILNNAVLADDLYVSVNNSAHWYKFGNLNPSELQQPVIGMCLLLSNHIDALTGHSAGNNQQPTPTFEPRGDAAPIGVVPLFCN